MAVITIKRTGTYNGYTTSNTIRTANLFKGQKIEGQVIHLGSYEINVDGTKAIRQSFDVYPSKTAVNSTIGLFKSIRLTDIDFYESKNYVIKGNQDKPNPTPNANDDPDPNKGKGNGGKNGNGSGLGESGLIDNLVSYLLVGYIALKLIRK